MRPPTDAVRPKEPRENPSLRERRRRIQDERRFLIAAGTSAYRYLDNAALPSVPRDVRAIADCFARLGYERVLADCSLLTSDPMLARLGAPQDPATVILAVEPPFTGPLIDSDAGAAGQDAPSQR